MNINNPHWLVVAFIGALIGCFLPIVLNLFRSIPRFFRRDAIVGDWYEYHYNFLNGTEKLYTGVINIRRGILKPFKAKYDAQDAGFKYKGYGWREGDHLIFQFRCKNHSESPVFRLPSTVLSNNTHIPGIWLAFDQNKRVAAGIILLSKEEIVIRSVKTFLKKRTICSEDCRIIRID